MTRNALFAAGAAWVVGACGGDSGVPDDEASGDATGGGELEGGDPAEDPIVQTHGGDAGAGPGANNVNTDTTADDSDEVAEAEAEQGERELAEAEAQRREVEQQRLVEEQRLREQQEDPRRHRTLPACYTEGTCPAPPYGAPPVRDPLV